MNALEIFAEQLSEIANECQRCIDREANTEERNKLIEALDTIGPIRDSMAILAASE